MEVKSNKRTTQAWNGFAAMLRTRGAIVHFQGTRTMNNRNYYYVIHFSRDFWFYRLQPDVKHPFKLIRPECRNWLWWLADCRSCQWVRIPTPYATIRMILYDAARSRWTIESLLKLPRIYILFVSPIQLKDSQHAIELDDIPRFLFAVLYLTAFVAVIYLKEWYWWTKYVGFLLLTLETWTKWVLFHLF